MYFWGEDGVIKHVTKSMMEALAFAISNNVQEAEDYNEADDDVMDDKEDVEMLSDLFKHMHRRGYDCNWTVQNEVVRKLAYGEKA